MVKLILLRLMESYFRHRWLYLVPTVLLLGVGIAIAFLVPPDYESPGTMMVEKESLLASLTSSGASAAIYVTPAQLTADELNELLATDAFVRSAIQKTALEANMSGDQQTIRDTFDEYRNSLMVTPLGSKLIEFRGTHADSQLAQQIAASAIESYIQWQINKDYQQSVVAQSFFANLITPYQEDLQRARDEMRNYLESYPEPLRGQRPPEEQMEIARLQAEIDQAEQRVTETLKNEESARLALAKSESLTRQTYVVIDTPVVPETSFSLRRALLTVIIFGVMGFFLSLAGIIFGALTDRTLRYPVDVKQALGLPVLATVASEKVVPFTGAREQTARGAQQASPADAVTKPGTLNPKA